MAGSLTIKGTTYALKAKQTPMTKERFYTAVRSMTGALVINNMGNAAKRTWQYTGECDVSVCQSLETSLDSAVNGTFTDHTGAAYNNCLFEFQYSASGYWRKCPWTLTVREA